MNLSCHQYVNVLKLIKKSHNLITQIYIVAEVLAVPALPLTASSGYLFGLIPGFLTVLVSATIAASISFLIGRTLLRDWAQKIASGEQQTLRHFEILSVSSNPMSVIILLLTLSFLCIAQDLRNGEQSTLRSESKDSKSFCCSECRHYFLLRYLIIYTA